MEYVLLVIGFVLLVKGADLFVEGAGGIARLLKVPSIIIGLTIVAFGTSAPEAAVSITAAIEGRNDIALGNVLGSNLFNLLVVAGISCIPAIVPMKNKVLMGQYALSVLGAVILLLIARDGTLGRLDGLLLLLFFLLFLYLVLKKPKEAEVRKEKEKEEKISWPKSICYTIFGLACIIFGGQLVVKEASAIARMWGATETLIGLTIVAVGTSLPELVTSIVAARKKENDIAIGNVIGSNLFNIFFILGSSSLIHPIAVASVTRIDTLILVIVSLVSFLIVKLRGKMERWLGIFMVISYFVYMYYIIVR